MGAGSAATRELRLIDRADFELEAGELVCLLGPNGSGKSTLLRTIAGMQRPLAGSVELLGHDVRTRTPEWLARHLSIVLTEPIDAGALTARELVGLGRYPFTDWLGRLTAVDRERIDAAIAAVGAEAIADRRVRSLSDGERQRVLIARALAQEPKLVILDEPTAYLDLPRRIETLGLLRRLVRENGVSVLLSTHHLDLALSHADRVWLLPLGRAARDRRAGGRRVVGRARAHLRVGPPGVRSRRRIVRPARGAGAGRGGARRRWAGAALGGARAAARGSGRGRRRRAAPRATPRRRRRQPPVIARVRIARRSPRRYLLETGGERSDCASIHELVARLRRASSRSSTLVGKQTVGELVEELVVLPHRLAVSPLEPEARLLQHARRRGVGLEHAGVDAPQPQRLEAVAADRADRGGGDAPAPVLPAEPVAELGGVAVDVALAIETDAAEHGPGRARDGEGERRRRGLGARPRDPVARVLEGVGMREAIAQEARHLAIVGQLLQGHRVVVAVRAQRVAVEARAGSPPLTAAGASRCGRAPRPPARATASPPGRAARSKSPSPATWV